MPGGEESLHLLLLRIASSGSDAAPRVAPVLGVTAYEVGLRFAAARGGAAVLAASREADEVDGWVSRLRGMDLDAMRIDRARVLARKRIEVRDWRLTDGRLRVAGASGGDVEVELSKLVAVIQALEVERRTERKVTSQRRLALGRFIATGGLMLTKKETREQRFHHMEPLHRLALYPPADLPVLWMAEEEVRYASLPRPLAPSRGRNFARVVEMLRARLSPSTFYDEQLLDHRRVAALLGAAAGSSDDLALAMGVIAEAGPRSRVAG